MIVYQNQGHFAWIFILFGRRGSVLPHAIGISMLSVAWCGVIIAYYLKSDQGTNEQWIDVLRISNPFGGQIYTTLLAFALVFRTRMALSRYEDGLSNVQMMLSKWTDSFCNIAAFLDGSLNIQDPKTGKPTLSEEETEDLLLWRVRLCHWYSLLSALAFVQLRGNLGTQFETLPIRSVGFNVRGIENRGVTMAKSMDPERESSNSGHLNKNGLPSLCGAADDSGHAVSTRWPRYTNNWSGWERNRFCYLGDLDRAEKAALITSVERVSMITRWIQASIIEKNMSGTFKVPPPILSRAVQELSNGVEGYHQALKVSLCQFPFVFAQLIYYMLILYIIIIPMLMPETCRNSPISAGALCFMSTLGMFGINAISEELEDPFGDDMNDLPLLELNHDYIASLEDCLLPTLHQMKFSSEKLEIEADLDLKRNTVQFGESAPLPQVVECEAVAQEVPKKKLTPPSINVPLVAPAASAASSRRPIHNEPDPNECVSDEKQLVVTTTISMPVGDHIVHKRTVAWNSTAPFDSPLPEHEARAERSRNGPRQRSLISKPPRVAAASVVSDQVPPVAVGRSSEPGRFQREGDEDAPVEN